MGLSQGIIVIGGSAGSISVVSGILTVLPADFGLPVVIVLHRRAVREPVLINTLQARAHLNIKEAEEKEQIKKGYVYIAPADYHLLIEKNHTFSLDAGEKVHYSRPSIDITFECAAEVYKNALIGVVLTGANADGAEGLKTIHDAGGLCVVENPATAEVSTMPARALAAVPHSYKVSADEIAGLLQHLAKENW